MCDFVFALELKSNIKPEAAGVKCKEPIVLVVFALELKSNIKREAAGVKCKEPIVLVKQSWI